jgi:GNAT superfamily N-acetyltransferase
LKETVEFILSIAYRFDFDRAAATLLPNTRFKYMTSDVAIRVLRDPDRADVCRIWVDGLEQSKKAVPWFLGPWFMSKMHELRDASLAESGDVGPNGKNLLQTYGGKDDRCMFVACMAEPRVVVGCCAVKKGMDETKPEQESQICSIWRMSVDENYRGHGIAAKLMAACEDWSREKGCTRMGLFTINPVAANFYVHRMGYKRADHFYIIKNSIAKLVIPPVIRYEKAIS